MFKKLLLVLRIEAAAVLPSWYDKSIDTLTLKYTRVGRKPTKKTALEKTLLVKLLFHEFSHLIFYLRNVTFIALCTTSFLTRHKMLFTENIRDLADVAALFEKALEKVPVMQSKILGPLFGISFWSARCLKTLSRLIRDHNFSNVSMFFRHTLFHNFCLCLQKQVKIFCLSPL